MTAIYVSPGDYLVRLKNVELREDLFDRLPDETGEKKIPDACTESLQQVQKVAPRADDILSLMACFAAGPVPKSLLQMDGEANLDWIEAMGILQ